MSESLHKGVNFADLFLNQGTDWHTGMEVTNEDGTPIDLTGYFIRGSFKYSYDTANVAAELIVSIIDPVNGIALVEMSAANSANVVAGRYFYDIIMTDSSNISTRVLEGILTIRPRVT